MGWGPAKEPASPCARVCQNYLLANYPLVSPVQQATLTTHTLLTKGVEVTPLIKGVDCQKLLVL